MTNLRVSPHCRAGRVACCDCCAGPVRLGAHLVGRRIRPCRQERRDGQQHPMVLMLLPFLGSGFVSTRTMPGGLRQFAAYQPFTPVADTTRGLLTNAAIGDHAVAAIAWSIGIAVAGYLWATRLYNRRRAAEPK